MHQSPPYREFEGPTGPHAREPQDYRELISQMIERMVPDFVRMEDVLLCRVSYPEHFDRDFPYPRGYWIPDFTHFFGEEDIAPIEHVARFPHQSGEVANCEPLKLLLFSELNDRGRILMVYKYATQLDKMWREMQT